MLTSRRQFMIGCSSAIAAMAGSRVLNLAWGAPAASAANDQRILVVVFLRGGMDGLNFLAPANDKDYVAARPPALRVMDSGAQSALSLSNGPAAGLDFRIHANAKPLKEIYDSGNLAFVHACGLTDGTRSHFEAMDLIERGALGSSRQNLGSGWLGRYLEQAGIAGASTGNTSRMPAVSGTSSVPNSLLGFNDAMPIPQASEFRFTGSPEQMAAVRELYKGDHPLQRAGTQTLSAFDIIQSKIVRGPGDQVQPYQPEHNAEYGETDIGHSLRSVAQLVKMDLGLSVATVDFGGWDTHQSQDYFFPILVTQLSQALGAFYNDLSSYHNRLNVVVQSEFGRRFKSNQSAGTDHGHGNFMMVMGGGVKGGRIYGNWPGLATEQLDSRADLAVTTDFRAVLAEVLQQRFALKEPSAVFPDFKDYKKLGLFEA